MVATNNDNRWPMTADLMISEDILWIHDERLHQSTWQQIYVINKTVFISPSFKIPNLIILWARCHARCSDHWSQSSFYQAHREKKEQELTLQVRSWGGLNSHSKLFSSIILFTFMKESISLLFVFGLSHINWFVQWNITFQDVNGDLVCLLFAWAWTRNCLFPSLFEEHTLASPFVQGRWITKKKMTLPTYRAAGWNWVARVTNQAALGPAQTGSWTRGDEQSSCRCICQGLQWDSARHRGLSNLQTISGLDRSGAGTLCEPGAHSFHHTHSSSCQSKLRI